MGVTWVINQYPVCGLPEYTTSVYLYSTHVCNTEYYCGIDARNKYVYKYPLVLSSLRQVTLHHKGLTKYRKCICQEQDILFTVP